MNIPEEVIRSGQKTIYADDDTSIEKDINEYNEYILECKMNKKEADYAKWGFWILNPLAVIVVIVSNLDTAFRYGALAYSMLVIYALSFVGFGISKRNFIFSTAVVPVLFVLDTLFIVLFIADALFTYLFEKYDRPIRDHLTYPVFYNINIRYSREKRPKTYDDFGR